MGFFTIDKITCLSMTSWFHLTSIQLNSPTCRWCKVFYLISSNINARDVISDYQRTVGYNLHSIIKKIWLSRIKSEKLFKSPNEMKKAEIWLIRCPPKLMSFLQLAAERETSFLVGISNKFQPFLFCQSFTQSCFSKKNAGNSKVVNNLGII